MAFLPPDRQVDDGFRIPVSSGIDGIDEITEEKNHLLKQAAVVCLLVVRPIARSLSRPSYSLSPLVEQSRRARAVTC